MIRFHIFINSLFIIVCLSVSAQEAVSPIDQYRESRQHLTARDARVLANDSVLLSPDADVIDEAIQDLLRFSSSEAENTDALESVESVMARTDEVSPAHWVASLAQGKLFKRLGRDVESERVFQTAIARQWQHAMWRYSESLIDAGELDRASILEYERVIGKGNYRHYRGEKEDFFIFITLLRLMKSDNPNAVAMDAVFPQLQEASDNLQAKNIAQALCLSEDGRYAEAIELLRQVDYDFSQSRENRRDPVLDEYRNTPLYLTSALLYQGEDLDAARASFQEFLRRNDGDWKYIYDRSMRVVRDLEMDVQHDLPHAQIITSQLLNSRIINDEEIKNSFSNDEIAGLYDLHQQSLAWGGQLDASAQMCKFVMDHYYPQTLAGANCAMNWARYISAVEGKVDEAEGIMLGILLDAPFPEITPWVKLSLAEVEVAKVNRFQALAYVNEVLEQVTDRAKGSVVRCRTQAQELKEFILNQPTSE